MFVANFLDGRGDSWVIIQDILQIIARQWEDLHVFDSAKGHSSGQVADQIHFTKHGARAKDVFTFLEIVGYLRLGGEMSRKLYLMGFPYVYSRFSPVEMIVPDRDPVHTVAPFTSPLTKSYTWCSTLW